MIKKIDFPPHLVQLDAYFLLQGMQLFLVGGAVRDFFLKEEKPHDYDLEVRLFNLKMPEEDWPNYLHQVIESLESEGYSYQKLSFSVYRLKHKIFGEIELSSARVEEYPPLAKSPDCYGHSDFKARAVGQVDDLNAMKRRDFTINALSLELVDGTLHDPYDGISHLKKKLLHPCSGDDFFKDPIRLFRLIRFEILLGFKRSDFIIKNLSKFNLIKATPHYLVYEAFKVNPLIFIRQLLDCQGVLFPDFILKLRPLLKMKLSVEAFNEIKNLGDFIFYMALSLESNKQNKIFLENFCDSFSLSQRVLINYLKMKEEMEELCSLRQSFFLKLAQGPIMTFCQNDKSALLLRFIGRLKQSDLAHKLKKYFPQEFTQINWAIHLLPLPAFDPVWGEECLKGQKKYLALIPLYLQLKNEVVP